MNQGDSKFSRFISTGKRSSGEKTCTWLLEFSNHFSRPNVTYKIGTPCSVIEVLAFSDIRPSRDLSCLSVRSVRT